jgi:RimJ/RimL family protein N-acetyltransferase
MNGRALGHAPVLETPRLRLEGPQPGDFDGSLGLWSDPQVFRFIGGRAFSAEEVWARLLRYVGHWNVLGYGYWVVREGASGRFLGEIGFGDMRRSIDPPFDAPEAGWAFVPEVQGRGYASEALACVLRFADERLAWAPRTVCMIDPRNLRSIRLAERFGYLSYARVRYREDPVLLFERPRAQASEVG